MIIDDSEAWAVAAASALGTLIRKSREADETLERAAKYEAVISEQAAEIDRLRAKAGEA